jgi:hypothetical protein
MDSQSSERATLKSSLIFSTVDFGEPYEGKRLFFQYLGFTTSCVHLTVMEESKQLEHPSDPATEIIGINT